MDGLALRPEDLEAPVAAGLRPQPRLPLLERLCCIISIIVTTTITIITQCYYYCYDYMITVTLL